MTSLVTTNGISLFLALPLSFLACGAMPYDYSHCTFVTRVPYSCHHADSYHCWKSCRAVSVNKKLADNTATKEKKVFSHCTGKAEAFSWIESCSLHPILTTSRDSIKCELVVQHHFVYPLKASLFSRVFLIKYINKFRQILKRHVGRESNCS